MERGDCVRGYWNDVLELVQVGEIIFGVLLHIYACILMCCEVHYNTIHIRNAGGDVYKALSALNHED